ncbi:MAG: V-type ATPase subunit, partial [Ruminiclostridium sp.]|nr:V-type ATPase subunit [Ruminiclostridium sp.]
RLSFDPMELALSEDLHGVAEAIRGTVYYRYTAPLLNEPEPDINRIITTINSCYIKWAFEQIDRKEHGRERERLKEFFLRKADADNLLICLRLKMLGVDNEKIHTFLVPFRKRLSTADITEALRANDPVAALNNLFISRRIAGNRISEIPEINVNAADRAYFRRCLVFSMNETESLYSLIMLMKSETTNLFRIIEGLRYGVAPEEIEKFLIV